MIDPPAPHRWVDPVSGSARLTEHVIAFRVPWSERGWRRYLEGE